MPIPNYRAKDQLKRYFTTDTVITRPSSWEVSLHTGNPVLGNEVLVGAWSNYARQSVTLAVADVDLGGAELVAQATNDIEVQFPAAAAGTSLVVTHAAIRDASTGEILAVGQASPAMSVVENTVILFAVGDILVQD